jgi:3-phosphoshikimate 1-carboxyvinyltransferase
MEIARAGALNGEINIPGDKSISHRSAMISSLACNDVRISNFLFSQDCISTVEALKKNGVKIVKIPEGLIVSGRGLQCFREADSVINTGNSGTAIRLLCGILAGAHSGDNKYLSVLEGDASINSRPMARIIKPLREMGAEIYGRDDSSRAPLVIFGKKLKGGYFDTEVASAQVKSCLLLAGLNADGEVKIRQPQVSRDHTERMLQYFGADINYDGRTAEISGEEELKEKTFLCPAIFLQQHTLL